MNTATEKVSPLSTLEREWNILTKVPIEPWTKPEFSGGGISVSVLRGDLHHPVLQGNKWHKLKGFIAKALDQKKQGLVSMGGAYSNHLQALAWAAKALNMKCILFIRGEEAEWKSNPAVIQLQNYGAEVKSLSRSEFRNIHTDTLLLEDFLSSTPDYQWVPMGGSGPECIPFVVDWARQIADDHSFDRLVIPAASAGTAAGFAAGLHEKHTLDVVEVLRSGGGLQHEMMRFIAGCKLSISARLVWHNGYNGSGYARTTQSLLEFCQAINRTERFHVEPVYTGKVFWAVSDLALKGHFPDGSRILIVHTGGLFPWTMP